MHYSKKHSLWMPYEEKDDIAIDVVTKEVEYIDEVMKYVRKREGCIQAGGHIGVYPKKLSTYFTRVFTFEPDLNNFECLKKNTEACPNIVVLNKGLSDKEDTVTFSVDKAPDGRKNSGSAFIKDGEYPSVTTFFDQDVTTIDFLFKEEEINFIQLDVEGHEYEVLKGGEEVIKRCKPIIMVEGIIKKDLMLQLLNKWGYYFILSNGTDGVLKK